jgi:hypothetical protein
MTSLGRRLYADALDAMCGNAPKEPHWAIISQLSLYVLRKVMDMNATALPKAATPPSPANIQLLQLTTACWASRCLHAVAELGVADALGDQPHSKTARSVSHARVRNSADFSGTFTPPFSEFTRLYYDFKADLPELGAV